MSGGGVIPGEAFVWQRRVGFGDCDPAGIAYTGRIPDFALEAIDRFWEALLDGDNWFRMNLDQGIGTPFVHLDFDFTAPITARAPLDLTVRAASLGTSSIHFGVTGGQNGTACFSARLICVTVRVPALETIPVPHRMRAALEARYPALQDERSSGRTPPPASDQG